MFKGQYAHALDAKGRVALPAAFRRLMSERGDEALVVTPHIREPCLTAYPDSAWAVYQAKIEQLSQLDPGASQLRRLIVGRAQDCPVDKVGRVLLPPSLRRAVGIDKELVWMGQLNCIEIWTPEELTQVAPMDARVEVSDETIAHAAALGL